MSGEGVIASDRAARAVTGATIQLRTGAYCDLSAPETCAIAIEDIAHGLSNICRFTGQCSRFYSVAEHSVLMSYLVPAHLALQALMHDAAEAVIGDVAKPLKMLLPDYRVVEERVERALFAAHDIPYPLDPAIKVADLRMLAAEKRALMYPDDWLMLSGIEPFDVMITGYLPTLARARFLARYRALTGSEA